MNSRVLMLSGTDTDTDTQTRMRGLATGGCGWPPLNCPRRDDDEEDHGSDPRPRSLSLENNEDGTKPKAGALDAASPPSLPESGMRSPQCRICFQGPEKGEMLSPCRCDGSVRCTHQACLIRWISERGSWSCELCYFKYQVLAISTKNPLQWQAISLTVIERVQIAAIILGSLFLVASVSWLVWSSLSPSAKWQHQDLLFQICYGMYGFMDVVCIDLVVAVSCTCPRFPNNDPERTCLIIHEGSSVYRIFKRWQAVNQQWKVLNYEKAKDLDDPMISSSKGRAERNSTHTVTENGQRASRYVRTILSHYCGYTILHILRANNLHHANQEVVMRVTTV